MCHSLSLSLSLSLSQCALFGRGELALQFGDLLGKLWAPRAFKSKLSAFAPQFSGYSQHDSQEFLAFFLDGLHENLNRVNYKPYIEAKEAKDRPDEEVVDEHWRNHLARNDSIIVDMCQIRDLIWTCLVIWRADGSSFCVFVHITLHVFWLRCKFSIFVSITGHVG
ncbi:ubiquitin carboxyl-terminal hydrolase 5-like [Camellia sinensis]|uniref:ubiquitin carboxyl-terminal hydrolase 5-like n=1 Tax=Camellia sinensis TaxID=4442 RepID=UPI001035FD6C|nr:ubiquitin carboxyl-terminal hydrolase 5-like [Camellia sinensis]